MNPNRRHPRRIVLLAGFALAVAVAFRGAPEAPRRRAPTAEPATLEVSGVGWWRDHELQRSLILLLGAQRGATLDANAIEDAAVMLVSALGEEGYQKPVVEIEITTAAGAVQRLVFDASMETAVPRPLAARTVVFRVKPGARWHVDSVEITGLTVLPVKTARAFFRLESMLFILAKTNAYSPAHVAGAAGALLGELHRRGYADAVVQADAAKIDEATGAVAVRVTVTEGARWQVAACTSRARRPPG
jgi:outer membrane protein insertion porin family